MTFLLLAAALLAGCQCVRLAPDTVFACGEGGSCPGGQVCVEGACELCESEFAGDRCATPDAGEVDAGSVDAGRVDAGAGTACDAGPQCAWGRCTGGVCDDPVQVSVGGRHTCIVRALGEVVCWGQNDFGQVTGSDGGPVLRPTVAMALGDGGGPFLVAAGWWHTCAAPKSGALLCWGSTEYAQLGNGVVGGGSMGAVTVLGRDGGALAGVGRAAAGGWHACAGADDLQVYCWGRNETYGQVGIGTVGRQEPYAAPLPGLDDATRLAAGGYHTCAVRGSGGVACWGGNWDGQAGAPASTLVPVPTDVAGLDGAVAVAAGERHSCAALDSGRVACWGNNSNQALGRTGDGGPNPVVVVGLDAVAEVAAGEHYTCARRLNGTVACWGRNNFRQLGADAGAGPFAAPQQVPGLADAIQISAGSGFHTCALRANGHVTCWGLNTAGQLGTGQVSAFEGPVDVAVP